MAPNDIVAFLRSLELRLLRCTIPSDHGNHSQSPPSIPSTSFSDLCSLLNDVVTLVESGRHVEALNAPAVEIIFPSLQFNSAVQFYNETVPNCVASFLNGSEEDSDELVGCKALILVALGVAALLVFIQCNFTGPQNNAPLMPLAEIVVHEDDSQNNVMEWEDWACKELMSLGSDLCAKFSNLQYLIFAKTLLMRTKDVIFQGEFTNVDGVRSLPWWLFRVLFLHQKLLVERSSLLFDLLQVFAHETSFELGIVGKMQAYWLAGEDFSTIQSMLRLELGIFELYYGRQDASRLHFESAAEISTYDLFVSGALGFRTVHQVEPKALLRLVAGEKHGDSRLPVRPDSSTKDSSNQDPPSTRDASDVYMTPRFIADEERSNDDYAQQNAVASPQLKAVHQAVIMAQCISVEKRARNDELQGWEMAPYIEAIDSQTSTPFMLRFFCNLLRVRWESSRSRTKQRALLLMDNLVESILNPSPGVAQRLHYCFGVNMPSIPVLRKEYADLLVSCGLLGEAMKIYEDLELWDNLIFCYKFEGKKPAAVELIKKCLSEKPTDARLWCSLAEVTNNDTYYEKALEVSQNRSVRALRSLARSAYGRGEYDQSKDLWVSAMTINSLHPDGWFGLGCAALKSKDLEKAIDAFTRTVQLDPEHGEAWNNIACIHLAKKRSKEAFVAFKEALKLKRDSWQMWENYGNVAADIGNFSQAIEAVQNVLEKSQKKKISVELLERIMVEMEGQGTYDIISQDNGNEFNSLKTDCGRKRETERLIEMLGRIFKQVVQSCGNAELWGLYARWHKLRGDLTMCSEALLKQVRSYQGSDLWKDRERFVKFARSSIELCKVYQQLASCGNDGGKELYAAAERHLKSTIKQAAVNFSDTEEFVDLEACLADVQNAMK